MNKLIKQKTYQSNFEKEIYIEDFRTYQHTLIEYFLKLVIEYITSNNNRYLTFDELTSKQLFTYNGIYQSELTEYSLYTKIKDEKTLFLKTLIPTLINNNSYTINGNLYIPLLYIVDKPLIIKENSIGLSSLFSPVTVYFKKHFVKFGGKNINLDYFTLLFLLDDESDESKSIKSYLSINNKNYKEKEILDYFSKLFGCDSKQLSIIKYIEDLFFDEYTKYLYSYCYFSGEIETVTFKELLKISFIKFIRNEQFSFIDLKNKRLSFIELLLAPLLQRAANVAHQVKRGFRPDQLKFDMYGVIKNFLKTETARSTQKKAGLGFHGLSGKNIYDVVNGFSAILQYKASFIKPGMSNPPSSVTNIHASHFGRICPITISSQDPGKVVSLIPETKVDIFGQFI